MRIRRYRRAYLATEYGTAFFGLATAYATLFRGVSPIPLLLILGGAVAAYLHESKQFDRRKLWNRAAVRRELPSMLALFAAVTAGMAGAVAVTAPEDLLTLPREAPLIWLLVFVLYPLLSVYPQELLFRTFIFERYRPVFGSGTAMVVASAAAFGYAHIVFGSWISVAMTAVGGWLFAERYRRSESLLAASTEHALYGVAAFTVGLGRYFYHGAARPRLRYSLDMRP